MPLSLAVMLFAAGRLGAQLTSESDTASAPPVLSSAAQHAADEIRSIHPEGSEALAMLEAIVSGDELSPGCGWFALSNLGTRFDWEYVRTTFDTDGDDSVAKVEWAASEADFDRVDRNGDKAITAADLDWSAPVLPRTPGGMIFSQSDADANGKITAEEFAALFAKLDAGGTGFLALEDLREKFQPLATPPTPPAEKRRMIPRSTRSCSRCGVRSWGRCDRGRNSMRSPRTSR